VYHRAFAASGDLAGGRVIQERRSIALAVALICLPAISASAADVQAGKATSQAKCSQCHEPDDWEGESAASLQSLISDIVAGKVKHKGKLELTEAEIANVAAYWGQGGKTK
jgi:mono/diheme cytochrome c family protein